MIGFIWYKLHFVHQMHLTQNVSGDPFVKFELVEGAGFLLRARLAIDLPLRGLSLPL